MAEQKATGTFNNPYLFNGKELDEETAMPSQTPNKSNNKRANGAVLSNLSSKEKDVLKNTRELLNSRSDKLQDILNQADEVSKKLE